MTPLATCSDTLFAGLPARELTLPQGDRLVVALHGAHILSWQSGGQERLYLSPQSVMDGQAAIRGGVPVCFPQFNQRGPMADCLPKHGFVRNVSWQADVAELSANTAHLTLRLSDNAQTRTGWPQAFAAELAIALSPGGLKITFRVQNTDQKPLAFSGALHTYLSVADVSKVTLQGLGGQAEWDSVTDAHAVAAPTLRFKGQFDRVYDAPNRPMLLDQQLQIEQSPAWANTVVWNPGPEVCAQLADMPADGWQHMLCVEAAQVFDPITLPPGAVWEAWQQLQVLNP